MFIDGNDKVDKLAKCYKNCPNDQKFYSSKDEPEWYMEVEKVVKPIKIIRKCVYKNLCKDNSKLVIKKSKWKGFDKVNLNMSFSPFINKSTNNKYISFLFKLQMNSLFLPTYNFERNICNIRNFSKSPKFKSIFCKDCSNERKVINDWFHVFFNCKKDGIEELRKILQGKMNEVIKDARFIDKIFSYKDRSVLLNSKVGCCSNKFERVVRCIECGMLSHMCCVEQVMFCSNCVGKSKYKKVCSYKNSIIKKAIINRKWNIHELINIQDSIFVLSKGRKLIHEPIFNKIASQRFALGFFLNDFDVKVKKKSERVDLFNLVIKFAHEVYSIVLKNQRKYNVKIERIVNKE